MQHYVLDATAEPKYLIDHQSANVIVANPVIPIPHSTYGKIQVDGVALRYVQSLRWNIMRMAWLPFD